VRSDRTVVRGPQRRALDALFDVLPQSVRESAVGPSGARADLRIAGSELEIKWLGEGSLSDVRSLLARSISVPDIVVARRLMPGARQALSEAGIGWVDETGAAEIVTDSLVVSRSGRPARPRHHSRRWNPSVLAVAEAILTGVRPTVAAASEATGLSVGSSTNALRFLADKGLLEAKVGRGPGSGRILADPAGLLDAYSGAVAELPDQLSLQVGVAWRDPPAGLVEVGRHWDEAWIRWVATGAVAATAIAPFLTSIGSTEAYVDAETIPGLEAVAAAVGLRAIEGGRLTLRPFPTTSVLRLAETVDGLRVAPWPRVYVDLMRVGVRGEDAAQHLREVALAG